MKILILTDSLDVGGAETHIESLVKELISANHEPIVASADGRIFQNLKNAGVRVILLPRINKNKKSSKITRSALHLRKTFAYIAKIVNRERPDIVHAHTRRTAFCAHFICKAAKIPLIVTAHALFLMDFFKKSLSKWGDYTIAVSEDIKKHLIQNGVKSSQITVIYNGVNLPERPKSPLFSPCQAERTHSKIIFVSRLDSDSSLGAYLLCKIAPKLAKKYENLQIIIVGGGTEYENILKISKKINAKFNRELIFPTGYLDNPSNLFDKNALFVGVSRAALEAMAHTLPVILLGNEGYLGLLDESKIELAKKTNFTCRNFSGNCDNSALSAHLFNEICNFFELPESEKLRLSTLCRKIAESEYGTTQMAEKTLAAYEKAIIMHQSKQNTVRYHGKGPRKKIAICGYYGRGNLGDEAILSALLNTIQKIPCNTEIRLLKTRTPIKNFFALRNADLFVFGGGSLLQNSTSNASLIYYFLTIYAANCLCKRKIMLSNGIGPIEDSLVSKETLLIRLKKTVNLFDFISARDTDSKKLLQNLLPSRKISLIRDPALTLSEETCEKEELIKSENCFLYIPSHNCLRKNNVDINSVANALSSVEETFKVPLVITVFNPEEDLDLAKKLQKTIKNARVECPESPRELKILLSKAKFVISERFHGTLFAAVCNTPVLSISSDPKIHSICKDIGLFPSQNPNIYLNNDAFGKELMQSLAHYERNKREILLKIKESKEKTRNNLEKIFNKFLLSP